MRICMSDAYQTIHLERMGAVAILTLSRPERMNAIDKQMLVRCGLRRSEWFPCDGDMLL